jgi:hypothetical protein
VCDGANSGAPGERERVREREKLWRDSDVGTRIQKERGGE